LYGCTAWPRIRTIDWILNPDLHAMAVTVVLYCLMLMINVNRQLGSRDSKFPLLHGYSFGLTELQRVVPQYIFLREFSSLLIKNTSIQSLSQMNSGRGCKGSFDSYEFHINCVGFESYRKKFYTYCLIHRNISIGINHLRIL
jgi:hypothetical protein